jgi:hypothetical protein
MPGFDVDHLTDFRDVAVVNLDQLPPASRVAAMTHEARVYLIRRELYFRYRWKVPIESVRANEADRISGDPAFQGPRPEWAPPAGTE